MLIVYLIVNVYILQGTCGTVDRVQDIMGSSPAAANSLCPIGKALTTIADVAQLKRHQRWSVSCKCACAVTAPVAPHMRIYNFHFTVDGILVVQHLLLPLYPRYKMESCWVSRSNSIW